MKQWSPTSWQKYDALQQPTYPDSDKLECVLNKLHRLPPLVTSWEIERLKSRLADASVGDRFILQGGDCAETMYDCTPEAIAAKLKILLQMSLILVLDAGKPIIRIGRFAGQYAKPRSSPTETRGNQTLPSYFGDLINQSAFTKAARTPDPQHLLQGYQHAAMTLNFIRALIDGGFADLHHPEYLELDFCTHNTLKDNYHKVVKTITQSIQFIEKTSEISMDRLSRVPFFTSHEGLNLLYESAGTRIVPRRDGYYNLTTHFPWIGYRTHQIDGAHVEFFRGLQNPIGVKIGPDANALELLQLTEILNPDNELGKLAFIHRFGATHIVNKLPNLIKTVQDQNKAIVWICDPMHGNNSTTAAGTKTRHIEDILTELNLAFDIHDAATSTLAGVHVELTGEHVTECIGGLSGLTENDLNSNYKSQCDPRLNYEQSLEIAFEIGKRLRHRNTQQT